VTRAKGWTGPTGRAIVSPVLDRNGLARLVHDGIVDTVVVAFCDLQGRPVGKRVTAHHFLDHVIDHGIEACDYLLAVDVDMEPVPGYRFTSWDTGYGDVTAMADLATLTRAPWLAGSAVVLCDVVDGNGDPVEVSPRRILQRQVERAAALGLEVRGATELEFYLFRESPAEAAKSGWRDLHGAGPGVFDYQLGPTGADEDVLRRVRNELREAGLPVEFSKGEAGPGQHEVNVTYGPVVRAADRHQLLKWAVRDIAGHHDRAVTFMAKWSMVNAGSSCHLHTSLWDARDGTGRMWSEDDPDHLSPVARRFVAGLVHGARDMAWLWAPNLNSYRRYVPGSWAPTAAVWGHDNRTCGFRVIGEGDGRRVECRIPGADVNPYLALAGLIAAGVWGIEHDLELGPAYQGNGYEAEDVPRVPDTLPEALAALQASTMATQAFGDDVHHHLVTTARHEWACANRVVTDWELARGFERL
jgi:glutamine synthetase